MRVPKTLVLDFVKGMWGSNVVHFSYKLRRPEKKMVLEKNGCLSQKLDQVSSTSDYLFYTLPMYETGTTLLPHIPFTQSRTRVFGTLIGV